MEDIREGPVDLSEYLESVCVPKCRESGTLSWGIQGGKAHLASLTEGKAQRLFLKWCISGLPQCETCLTTSLRFRSLGGRSDVVSGFAFARKVTELFNGFSLVEKSLNDGVERLTKAGLNEGYEVGKEGNCFVPIWHEVNSLLGAGAS